jgi:phage repressor protein C with HTH and peptisase S24 domain
MIREIRELALDLNVDEKELRMMISRSFAMAGISKSWERKLLPEYLKFTKHTRKDYLERQQQLEQQSLMKPPQLQPSNGKATEVTSFGNNLPELLQQEQKQKEEGLRQRIEELQRENRYLRGITTNQTQQLEQQQQEEETFTGIGNLELGKFHMRLKVTVNVRTKSIEFIDIAW